MALNYIEKAIKLDPTHAPTLLNRKKVLFALGYKKQALAQAHLGRGNWPKPALLRPESSPS